MDQRDVHDTRARLAGGGNCGWRLAPGARGPRDARQGKQQEQERLVAEAWSN
jgi:hypothetical protein